MTAIRNKRGFTLVEVGIMLSIFAIVAVMALPDVRGMIQRYQFNAAVRRAKTDLNLARLKAISRNREVRVRVDTNGESYAVEQGNASTGSTTWTTESSKTMGQGIDIFQVEGHADDNIMFKVNGSVKDNPNDNFIGFEFRGQNATQRKRINIETSTGRMYLQYFDGHWKDEEA
jgi:Tfp pilus assembly protein FimT